WAVVNERDELGPNLVPDYLTSVKEGAFYGWPWSYYGNHVDERVHPPRPDMVERAIAPDYALSSHVAALGLTFSNNSAMPEPYRNGAFVGNRGSWNRSQFNGYKVLYVPFENGRPAGMPVDVVTGFLDGDKARGRPVGVGIDGTGALLVADDAGNTVWRVAPADGTVTPEPIATDAPPNNPTAPTAAAPAPGVPPAGTPAPADVTTGTTDRLPADTSPPPAAAPAPAEAPAAPDAGAAGGPEPVNPPQTDIAPAVQPEGAVQDSPDSGQ
ncbi:MAG TPA: sorbosone dehydrogenase family protein, partial [Pseudorhizobium sp.]|nr:sorbosone dehydrogenase family protein [Pseudorhizobium sp.]